MRLNRRLSRAARSRMITWLSMTGLVSSPSSTLVTPAAARLRRAVIPTDPYNSMESHGRGGLGGREAPGQGTAQHGATRAGRPGMIHDIFEGTEQIQQLVISRAISGLRIE